MYVYAHLDLELGSSAVSNNVQWCKTDNEQNAKNSEGNKTPVSVFNPK
jgi:hypothetical protein